MLYAKLMLEELACHALRVDRSGLLRDLLKWQPDKRYLDLSRAGFSKAQPKVAVITAKYPIYIVSGMAVTDGQSLGERRPTEAAC